MSTDYGLSQGLQNVFTECSFDMGIVVKLAQITTSGGDVYLRIVILCILYDVIVDFFSRSLLPMYE